ncbi:MAG TPA: Rieske 2Fe-2S domain-containing protein [Terriglobales bacterium]|nr:Rieske 2Fe-2S domain-containing protein [Terriglobales bacterium]
MPAKEGFAPYPTQTAHPDHSTRRRFLQVLLGGGVLASLASFLYPVIRYIIPPATTDLGVDSVLAGTVAELKPNSYKIFRFGSRPGLLVLTANGEYKAMSATCTHLSCTVQYRPDLRQIWCACHNGKYDLNGRNVSGPPPRPLEAYEVHVRGQEIYVSRKQGA